MTAATAGPGPRAALRMTPPAWVLYAGAWLAYTGVVTLILRGDAGSWPEAAVRAFNTVLPGAALGVAATIGALQLAAGRRRTAALVAVHAGRSLVYAGLWVAGIWLLIAADADAAAATTVLREFAGWQLLTGLGLYAVMAGLATTVAARERLREEQVARATVELQALRGQLNPHFLFNTLHSVGALVRQDPAAAEDALQRLALLLRYVLAPGHGADGDDVTLGRELAFVDDYLALEALRLGTRLRVERQVDSAVLDARMPALTLQPLVENAVRHGIAPRPAGGLVRLTVWRDGSRAAFSVEDDGTGGGVPSTGIGLTAVRQRLAARFADAAALEAGPLPSGWRATVRVPLEDLP